MIFKNNNCHLKLKEINAATQAVGYDAFYYTGKKNRIRTDIVEFFDRETGEKIKNSYIIVPKGILKWMKKEYIIEDKWDVKRIIKENTHDEFKIN